MPYQNYQIFTTSRHGYDASVVGNLDPEPPHLPWPIGTIVKWDYTINGVKSHIDGLGRKDRNLLKILAYTPDGEITKYRYINECEDSSGRYEKRYFRAASEAEIDQYNTVMDAMKQCTEYPAIGTVLEYIDVVHGPSSIGKRGVVLSHARNNQVLFHWFNRDVSDTNLLFAWFRISSNQRNGFKLSEEDYCHCDNCGSMRRLDYTFSCGDQRYCDSYCAEQDGWLKCNYCGVRVKERIDTLNGPYCTVCVEEHCQECDTCGSVDRNSNMEQNEDVWACYRCVEGRTRLIHQHGYKPHFHFQKMAWENTRYLGIELEIEVDGGDVIRSMLADLIKKWLEDQPKSLDVKTREGKIIAGKSLDKLVYMQNDGSLHNGIEIVFHPFTLKSFHKNFPLKGFLKLLEDNRAVIRENCGMHVHVSKERLSTNDLLKGKWFFHQCAPYLKRFSERRHFNYCKFDQWSPGRDPYYQDAGHYSVLNIVKSAPTLEVRVFNATLDYKKFLANLQFSDCFVDYIQHGAGIAFVRRSPPAVVWQNFIDYAKAQNRYHLFTSWVLTRAIV